MNPLPDHRASRSMFAAVLTDLHFWVPLAVLAGGLILLEWIH